MPRTRGFFHGIEVNALGFAGRLLARDQEQLAFLRPAIGWAHYETPVRNLWMCASGTHPGGGLMGAPGALCARTMLEGRVL